MNFLVSYSFILKILHFPDSKYQTFFNDLGCHVLCLLTLLIVLIFLIQLYILLRSLSPFA